MEQQTLNLVSHPDFEIQAREFQQKYNLFKIVHTGDERYSKRNLRGYSTRTCLFCGSSYPDTPFDHYSHLLSKMMGNTNLYSDFECDTCNDKFSDFENDLANFFGISRSIIGLSGKKQALGFEGRKIGVKSRSFLGNNILIIAPEDVKREGTKTSISYIKNPFTPSKVYKALLKCALSLLTNEEAKKHYGLALGYLAGRGIITTGAVIRGYELSFQTNFPLHVYAFRKKFKEDKIPTHVICSYFQNHIIAFPLPFHEADLACSSELDILLPPPYFVSGDDMANSMPMPYLRDLSSTAKVCDEEETITYQLDFEALKNLRRYDPITDEYYEEVEYNPASVKYIIVTKEGVTVDPKVLSAFIKEQMEKSE